MGWAGLLGVPDIDMVMAGPLSPDPLGVLVWVNPWDPVFFGAFVANVGGPSSCRERRFRW